jgi:hypothetical protein
MSEICSICGAPMGNVADLVEHMQETHKHDDPTSSVEMNPEAHRPGLVCALCGRRFPNARTLAAHNMEPHSQPVARRPFPGPLTG